MWASTRSRRYWSSRGNRQMVVAPLGSGSTDKEAAEGKVPVHIAIIMDGNGRWAKQRGLPRPAGHRAGTDNIRRVIESAVEHGVKMLTPVSYTHMTLPTNRE